MLKHTNATEELKSFVLPFELRRGPVQIKKTLSICRKYDYCELLSSKVKVDEKTLVK